MVDRQDQPELVPDRTDLGATPGESLRRAREARGYDISDVAKRLHLPARVVEALEQDRYGDLPEAAYVKGYIGAYARFVELEPGPLIASYQDRIQPEDPTIFTSRMPQVHRTPRLVVVWGVFAVALVCIVLGVNWWLGRQNGGPVGTPAGAVSRTGTVPETRVEANTEAAPATAASTGLSDPPSPSDPAPAPTPVVESLDEVSGPLPDDVPEPVSESVPEPVARVDVDEAPVPAGSSRLVLTFRDQSWSEVYDNEDNRLVFDLIKSGEIREVVGQPPFRVVLGNAGGVQVQLDGESVAIQPSDMRGTTARFSVGTAPVVP